MITTLQALIDRMFPDAGVSAKFAAGSSAFVLSVDTGDGVAFKQYPEDTFSGETPEALVGQIDEVVEAFLADLGQ